MFTELALGYFKAREARVPWFPDRFLGALTAGAAFAGQKLGVRIGRIEKGAAADLVIADVLPGPPLSAGNLPGAFAFRFSAQMVRHVMVAGQWRLWNRDPVGIDVQKLDARAQKAALDVWGRMA
jgi:cytosine/adenosine deaminase-related metal-dependent hydrolase